ncbi:MAG: methyltransferase domain-containing protein [Microgenomates group bacterium]
MTASLLETLDLRRRVETSLVNSGWYGDADRSADFYLDFFPSIPKIMREIKSTSQNPRALDMGCGTGRAARELQDTFHIPFDGVSLVFYPPIEEHKFLDPERITIAHSGNTELQKGIYNFITSVGCLDIGGTLSYLKQEVEPVFDLMAPGGYFLLARTSPLTHEKLDEYQRFLSYAEGYGLKMRTDLMALSPTPYKLGSVIFQK